MRRVFYGLALVLLGFGAGAWTSAKWGCWFTAPNGYWCVLYPGGEIPARIEPVVTPTPAFAHELPTMAPISGY